MLEIDDEPIDIDKADRDGVLVDGWYFVSADLSDTVDAGTATYVANAAADFMRLVAMVRTVRPLDLSGQ